MEYYINPANFNPAFSVPSAVVDRHIKFAKAEHIRILLYLLKNMSEDLTEAYIASELSTTEYEVREAMLYWADAGILMPKNPVGSNIESAPKAVVQNVKPTRSDVAKRGLEDPKIQFLLSQAQIKFGRNLKNNEASTLVWLYDDQGLDVSLILLIIQYAATKNKLNIRFVESTAVDWVNRGIDNITDADAELKRLSLGEQCWKTVSAAFGLEKRKPSKNETEKSLLWVDEWKLSKEMLSAAYDACIDAKSKFSFPYVSSILENWHKKGYEKPEDIEKKTEQKKTGAAYDLDLFEKMLNSKD